jgi:hypothetical protein
LRGRELQTDNSDTNICDVVLIIEKGWGGVYPGYNKKYEGVMGKLHDVLTILKKIPNFNLTSLQEG